jgi:hypothetical protein
MEHDGLIRGADIRQDRRMLSISRPTKLPNTPSAATKEAARSIIHSQLVCCSDAKDMNFY